MRNADASSRATTDIQPPIFYEAPHREWGRLRPKWSRADAAARRLWPCEMREDRTRPNAPFATAWEGEWSASTFGDLSTRLRERER